MRSHALSTEPRDARGTHDTAGAPNAPAAPAAPAAPGTRVADSARRRTSASAVLRTVLEDGPVPRSTIARRTGLSPASVTGHCAQLARLGLIRESPEALRTNGVGRPHTPVDLDSSRFLAGGVHVAVPFTTVALLDLRGRVVAQRRLTHHDGTEPGRILARAAEGLDALRAARDPAATLLGVGVATGGWVDRDRGTVVEHPLLGWHEVAVRDLLGGLTGLPVHADAHSRALANAERLFGATRATGRSSLHLFIGNVVDAAFVTGDHVHHGPRSQAGAIAHLPVEDGTRPCPCGRTGCLQAEVSEQTLSRRAYEAGIVAAPDPQLVLAAAEDGDPVAVRLLLERARLVGRATALLLDVLNPDTVVVTELGVIHRADCLAALRAEAGARTSAVIDVERAVVPISFRADDVLAMAGGSVALDVLYRDPLGVLAH